MSESWRPAAALPALRARAELLTALRAFFAARGVLEVETPLLCHTCGSDPNLQAIQALYRPEGAPEARRLYLQTSPEFGMKRLLAAGSGPIYQIGKAFRDGERGGRHNPEFTMLEWYRPGFDQHGLMDEVEALLRETTGIAAVERLSYRELFRRHLDLDPHAATAGELAARARQAIDTSLGAEDRDTWLDLLYSHLIEPRLRGAFFIHDYPASQAALARVERDEEGRWVARRFELVVDGMEIANGYHELADPAEQRRRFERDLDQREARGLPRPLLDERLLAALEQGLPDCAGVALGVDRLLMLRLGAGHIDEVLAFPLERA